MKKSILLYCLLVFTASCQKEKAGCFSGLGDSFTDTLLMPAGIDHVTANGRIHVHFIQDSLNLIEISGGENVIEGIHCSFDNNQIHIEDNNTCNWVRRLDQVPVVTIHYTTLHYFEAANFYDNLFLKPHSGDTLLMEYWIGSGKTTFDGHVDRAYFKINAGSGNFTCTGSADYCYIYHSGGGRIDCSEFESTDVFAVTQSNNDVYVSPVSSLLGDIRRTGYIYYSGNPLEITRIGLGSGQILPN
ncbi:MAG: DUF2807 domain-containing protein [Bacteroidales bacterium]